MISIFIVLLSPSSSFLPAPGLAQRYILIQSSLPSPNLDLNDSNDSVIGLSPGPSICKPYHDQWRYLNDQKAE